MRLATGSAGTMRSCGPFPRSRPAVPVTSQQGDSCFGIKMASKASVADAPVGQSWSMWSKYLNSKSFSSSSPSGGGALKSWLHSDSMKLKKEDMGLFGFCPLRDEFTLAICNICHVAVKPQAFKTHMDKKHKTRGDGNAIPELDKSITLQGTSKETSGLRSKKTKRSKATKADNTIPVISIPEIPVPRARVLTESKATLPSPQKPPPIPEDELENVAKCASEEEAFSDGKPLAKRLKLAPVDSRLRNGACDPVIVPLSRQDTLPMNEAPSQGSSTVPSSSDSSASGSKKQRKLLPLKDRTFDPDRHCGVWIPELNQPCARSLTCKTHGMLAKRAVQGRSKSYKELLEEHRSAKDPNRSKPSTPSSSASKSPQAGAFQSPSPVTGPVMPELSLELPSSLLASGHLASTQVYLPPPVLTLASSLPLMNIQPQQQQHSVTIPITPTPASAAEQPSLAARVHHHSGHDDPFRDIPVSPDHPKPLAVTGFRMRRLGGTQTMRRNFDHARRALTGAVRGVKPSPSLVFNPTSSALNLQSGNHSGSPHPLVSGKSVLLRRPVPSPSSAPSPQHIVPIPVFNGQAIRSATPTTLPQGASLLLNSTGQTKPLTQSVVLNAVHTVASNIAPRQTISMTKAPAGNSLLTCRPVVNSILLDQLNGGNTALQNAGTPTQYVTVSIPNGVTLGTATQQIQKNLLKVGVTNASMSSAGMKQSIVISPAAFQTQPGPSISAGGGCERLKVQLDGSLSSQQGFPITVEFPRQASANPNSGQIITGGQPVTYLTSLPSSGTLTFQQVLNPQMLSQLQLPQGQGPSGKTLMTTSSKLAPAGTNLPLRIFTSKQLAAPIPHDQKPNS
ncbi:unnamed protein product [Darwinula stevensoni]|uniref:SCA7 domain-containing protein n=1 Tax=Darwinula stevensoni TaxID=69355 RepID=A0A7R9AC02_9CRUS|nr:unnamed protein product [Darwinula stevensoni]CAG0899662.1 unnamed protein product [Darwinula stevensoni]